MSDSNPFLLANRAKRVHLLVTYFDRFMSATGMSGPGDAALLAQTLRNMKQPIWNAHGVAAGLSAKRPPSSETIDSVIAVYQGRAEASRSSDSNEDPFARVSA